MISRYGGTHLTISGSGFIDPAVYFQVDREGAHIECEIAAADYTMIECDLAKISTDDNQQDRTLWGTVVVGGTAYKIDQGIDFLLPG